MENLNLADSTRATMARFNLTRKEVVKRMCVTNFSNGYIQFDKMLEGGNQVISQLEMLSAGLGAPLDELVAAHMIMQSENDILRERERQERIQRFRERFLPHLLAISTNRIPSPIFLGAITDHLRYINFDKSFRKLRHEEQLDRVKEAIACHFLMTEGRIAGSGQILH
jgi:hypothetical protein